MRAWIALAILGVAGAGAQQGETGQNPAAQKVRDHLRNISATPGQSGRREQSDRSVTGNAGAIRAWRERPSISGRTKPPLINRDAEDTTL